MFTLWTHKQFFKYKEEDYRIIIYDLIDGSVCSFHESSSYGMHIPYHTKYNNIGFYCRFYPRFEMRHS